MKKLILFALLPILTIPFVLHSRDLGLHQAESNKSFDDETRRTLEETYRWSLQEIRGRSTSSASDNNFNPELQKEIDKIKQQYNRDYRFLNPSRENRKKLVAYYIWKHLKWAIPHVEGLVEIVDYIMKNNHICGAIFDRDINGDPTYISKKGVAGTIEASILIIKIGMIDEFVKTGSSTPLSYEKVKEILENKIYLNPRNLVATGLFRRLGPLELIDTEPLYLVYAQRIELDTLCTQRIGSRVEFTLPDFNNAGGSRRLEDRKDH